MEDILALLQPIAPLISKTTLRQLSRVIFGMLAMTGRVTMLGISRWTGKGGSYRTLQCWYSTELPWAKIFWSFFVKLLWQPGDEYLLLQRQPVPSPRRNPYALLSGLLDVGGNLFFFLAQQNTRLDVALIVV